MKKFLLLLFITVSVLSGYFYLQIQTRFKETEPLEENSKFDFIVIGSGSGGSVVASRLSENPKVNVLLLEAGEPDNILEIKLPPAFAKLFKGKHDWNYETVPQEKLNNRKLYWPRGKLVGGTSSLNAMMYQRGVPSDFNGWEQLGNKGWSYKDVLPFFKKSERNLRSKEQVDEGFKKFHGFDGELAITDQGIHAATEVLLQSVINEDKENNKYNPDLNNGDNPSGVSKIQTHKFRGQRFSSADAFLSQKVLDRKNFHIKLGAHVTKLLVKKEGDKVKVEGVEVSIKGKLKKVYATKEVILSAGATNSPQILMLSGIGPQSELKKHKIPVNKHLNGVGKNLQDHVAVSISYNTSLTTLNTQESLVNMLKWAVQGKGPLRSNLGEIVWLGKTKYAPKDNSKVGSIDLEIVGAPCTFINHGFTAKPGNLLSLFTYVTKPKSRGTITLRSSNPFDKPIIDPKYFSNEHDLNVLAEGLKKTRRIFAIKPVSDVVNDREVYPGYKSLPKDASDDQIKDFIRKHAQTAYHPTSSCKMGSIEDDGVVNEELKVHGVDGLRIIDASVFPFVVTGHTHSATIMVGEKGAQLIKDEYKL